MQVESGRVFDGTNLRKYWQRACAKCGLGTLTEVEGKRDPRYAGLIVHDLRRSAIKNLMKAGVNEKVAMAISGHKTRSVFDRYHIVDETDILEAIRRVQSQKFDELVSESSVRVTSGRRALKQYVLLHHRQKGRQFSRTLAVALCCTHLC